MNIPLLLRLREAAGAFVPMADLGTDPDGVREDLRTFEVFGFAIERHPYLGVAYRGPAERLCPDLIEHDLATRRVGRRIAVWNRVASTNDLAARAAVSSSNEGLVVLAEEQTAGRGSRGRTWLAPPRSSILMSALLFPPKSLAETAWLTALGAVATADVVARFTEASVQIKWPNDVRVEGRKIAGILVERGSGAVVGIGLNVNIALDQFPADIRQAATSLQALSGSPVDRSEIARLLIRALDHWYELGLTIGPESLNAPWQERSEQFGRVVRVETRSGSVVGRLARLDLREGLTLQDGGPQPIRVPYRDVLSLSDHQGA